MHSETVIFTIYIICLDTHSKTKDSAPNLLQRTKMYSGGKETLCIVECSDSKCCLPRFPQIRNIAHFSSDIRNPTTATSVQNSYFSPITSQITQSILRHKQMFPESSSIILMLVLPILPKVIDISCQKKMGVVQCLTS